MGEYTWPSSYILRRRSISLSAQARRTLHAVDEAHHMLQDFQVTGNQLVDSDIISRFMLGNASDAGLIRNCRGKRFLVNDSAVSWIRQGFRAGSQHAKRRLSPRFIPKPLGIAEDCSELELAGPIQLATSLALPLSHHHGIMSL